MNREDALDLVHSVERFLRRQGKKAGEAVENGGFTCLYRAPDGSKCAIGCLIADEHYNPTLEGLPFNSEAIVNALSLSGIKRIPDSIGSEIVYIHDNYEPEQWTTAFSRLRSNIVSGFVNLDFSTVCPT